MLKKFGKGIRLSLNYFGSKFICIIYRYGTNYKQCHHVRNFSTMLSISNELKFTKLLSRYIIKLKLRFLMKNIIIELHIWSILLKINFLFFKNLEEEILFS